MRKAALITLAMSALFAIEGQAQSAVDAYDITQVQLRGTARFVGMGGAFTSLGGDLSSMTQNPAGIGIYRSSDIGFTVDLSFAKSSTETGFGKFDKNETFFKFDNFGYVGVQPLSGALRNINWGVSYSRLNSFDRSFNGQNDPTGTSLSNYVAAFTNVSSDGLIIDEDHDNPYLSTDNDWLSILAFNSYMISNVPGSDTQYAGLYQNGTHGDALYNVRERGYTDEYNIDFAGNVSDVVFWGFGIGIRDMEFTRESFYSESMSNALVYDTETDQLTNGNAGFDLYNVKRTTGSGVNLKLGVILRPVEMLRIGLAVHTPTWYHLNHTGYGQVDFNYTPNGSDLNSSDGRPLDTPDFDYDSRLNSPWRFMAGASMVIGQQAIVSLDYERVAYNDMKMKYQAYSNGAFGGGFIEDTQGNADIKDYYKAANIIRLGVEYRLTRSFSLRAGYNYQTTSVKDKAADNVFQISTVGTDPSYIFSRDTNNITLGLGYKYKNWYIDAAYQYTRRENTYHAYTSFDGNIAPTAKLTDTHNNIVISTGFRF